MKRIICLLLLYFTLPINSLSQTPQEFKERRERLMENISPESIIIINGSSKTLRNGDVYYPFRQSSNPYYLSGIEEPDCILLLSPGRKIYTEKRLEYVKELLFFKPKSERAKVWDGFGLKTEEIKEKSGIEETLPNTEYKSYLRRILVETDTLFFENLSYEKQLTEELIKTNENIDKLETALISNKINKMREIKSPSEIKYIKKAVEITSEAHKKIMTSAEPGMYEYELQAIIEYIFKKNGALRNGFLPIIGSGPNSCTLHYNKNNRKIEPGELVVIDIGAEYNMYSADITRTIPVSGKFSDRQKEIYNIVLKAHDEAINIIRQGLEKKEIHNKAVEIISEGLVNLGLLKDKNEYRKYYMHRSSHPIGLDVHDPSISTTLKSGMIITVEPGIYIREENIGIRIEDDILVTENGYEVLSNSVPVTIEEIEALMNNN